MKLEVFELERFQSEWEHQVEYNLTESGIQPLQVKELLTSENLISKMLDIRLGYSQTNGTIPLRQLVSDIYPTAGVDNVLITVGGAEANFVSSWYLLKEVPGNEIALMLPNYMQIHGLWKNKGGKVNPFYLYPRDGRWQLDVEELKKAVTSNTSAITICNPNNPTGAVLDSNDLKVVVDLAEDKDIWILSDEIYRGAELSGALTPSVFDIYDKVMVTSSLSKVYGLPGLRLGWIVCSSDSVTHDLWTHTDYTTICPAKLSDWLAILALDSSLQESIRERLRDHLRSNWTVMENWLQHHSDVFSFIPPKAAAICFPKHNLPMTSLEFVDRLRKEKSVLIIPGEQFGMESYFRIGFGYEKDGLTQGLNRVSELIESVK
jgi:aspartate/methionine/tyrosine aminotransferase